MNTLICTIGWNICDKDAWVKRLGAINNCTLLQSYEYARAVSGAYNQVPVWGLITIDGQEAGLVQAMEASILRKAVHAIVVDRGPLWFDGYGNEEHFTAFILEYNRQFPKRFGRKRRFIPEMRKSSKIDEIMCRNGFSKTKNSSYQTAHLNIVPDVDDLRSNLRKSWRQSLNKAERAPFVVGWDTKAESLSWLLKVYDIDKRARDYDGPDIPILWALGSEFSKEENALIGIARLDNRPIAAILVLCHGQGATYQIGWSTEDGRKYYAHHRLLWDAVLRLKDKNITTFDLGGMNDGGASSIKTFKTGLGGELVELAGLYV